MVTWSPEDIHELKNLAEAGMSPLRIAARLKRRVSAIHRVAHEHGIKLKSRGEVRESYGLSAKWHSNRNN
jgi:hypothetical protein